jgi:hypothetical protein
MARPACDASFFPERHLQIESGAVRLPSWPLAILVSIYPSTNLLMMLRSSNDTQVRSGSCLRLEHCLLHVCDHRSLRNSALPLPASSSTREAQCCLAEDNGCHTLSVLSGIPDIVLAVLVPVSGRDVPRAGGICLLLWWVYPRSTT